jgi:hypothetical protein
MIPQSQRFLPENPYSSPAKNAWNDLRSIKYVTPWIPFVVEAVVLVVLLIVFSLLYITVGIVSQIHQILMAKAEEVKGFLPEAISNVQKSAWTISLGIYYVLAAPFWVFQFPFHYLGWAGHRSRFLLVVSLALGAFLLWHYTRSGSEHQSLFQALYGLVVQLYSQVVGPR